MGHLSLYLVEEALEMLGGGKDTCVLFGLIQSMTEWKTSFCGIKLYFSLAVERNKWKMFSHTPLGPGPEGLFFESRAQCILSVAALLTYILY